MISKKVALPYPKTLMITPLLDRTLATVSAQQKLPNAYCFGIIETDTTIGSCILLNNGLVLVSLHVIFNLSEHKQLETNPTLDIDALYAPLPSIHLSFIKNSIAYTCTVSEITQDGRAHLYHDRVDSNFGWDYALLKPAEDLQTLLGPGTTLESTDYTYGRGLLTENPAQTMFVSRPLIDWANFEFSQAVLTAAPKQPPAGPLSLHGDDPTPKLPSFSGGAVLAGNQVYQIKHSTQYSLYTASILDFMRRKVSDTRQLPYYYKFGISAVLLIGKKEKKKAVAEAEEPTIDKSIKGSLPLDKFRSAVNEVSEFMWKNTEKEGTAKVWEIRKTERWDFHLTACTNPTAQHVVKFHFTLRDRTNGDKSTSAFAWFTIVGHGKEAALGPRENASEVRLFTDPEIDAETQAHLERIETYAAQIFEKALAYTK